MAINIPATLVKVDRTLIAQGLYTPATYSETIIKNSNVYDPITGTYDTSAPTLHSFNVVFLNSDHNSQEDNRYSVTAEIMILPQNISFEPNMDQIYVIKGHNWHVSGIKLSPLDSLWEITVGRK